MRIASYKSGQSVIHISELMEISDRIIAPMISFGNMKIMQKGMPSM